MSLSETLSPTPERLRKGDRIDAPEYTQAVKRPAYRKLHKFEELHQAGRINDGCFTAGNKLITHYYGAQGCDVRLEDWSTGLGNVGDARAAHAADLAAARRYINNKVSWGALMAVVEESKTLEDIGRDVFQCKQRGQAFIAGLAILSMALEDLAVLWGFSQSYHDRNPPSR